MNELEEMLFLAKEELSDEADRKNIDSQIFTVSSYLFHIKLFLGIRVLKLFEKTLPEKMELINDIISGDYNLGINDYDYWTGNIYQEDLESAHYQLIKYERDYRSNTINETAFNEFYKDVLNLHF